MRIRLTGILAAVLTGILLLFLASAGERAASSVSGGENPADSGAAKIRFLSEQQMEEELEKRARSPFSAAGLDWKGGPPAFDAASGTVYLPCDPDALQTWEDDAREDPATGENGDFSLWRSILSSLQPGSPEGEICVLKEDMLRTPATAVREGHAFSACLLTPDSAEKFSFVLTGLPILSLTRTDGQEILKKEEHEGRIRFLAAGNPLRDPEENPPEEIGKEPSEEAGKEPPEETGKEPPEETGKEPSEETGKKSAEALFPQTGVEETSDSLRCVFHVRGNVTSALAKKPYRISILDDAGEKKKVSFAGLRTDDDWILNPLYTDASRVREKTAYALWEEVSACAENPQPSSRMQYVELFLDDACQGIYGLMEPVDRLQLGLSEGDLLYKIDRWDREYPYLDLYSQAEKEQKTEIYNDYGFPCVEIKYPRVWDRTASWEPMRVFHSFSFRTGDPSDLTEAGLETDLDSVTTLSLFCALTHAMDNNWKNSFLIARKTEEGSYVLRRTAWDLNFVFGDVFIYDPDAGYTQFDAGTAFSYTPGQDSTCDFEAFLAADPGLREALEEKWKAWRGAGISADRICGLARENYDLLTKSGAMKREREIWSRDMDDADALSRMETWIRRRFLFLDNYFSGS